MQDIYLGVLQEVVSNNLVTIILILKSGTVISLLEQHMYVLSKQYLYRQSIWFMIVSSHDLNLYCFLLSSLCI